MSVPVAFYLEGSFFAGVSDTSNGSCYVEVRE